MSNSNYFPNVDYDLLPKRYGQEPSQALLFDGVSATVPTLVKGSVVFGGAKNKLGGKDEPFKIRFDRIIGYDVHCCLPSAKKRVRFKCCSFDACTNEEFTTINLQFISDEKFPIGLSFGLERDTIIVPIVEDCGASDCCRVIGALAKQINEKGADYPVIAIAAQEGSTWYLDIEAKNAGQDFIVTGVDNLLVALKVPNYRQSFTAKSLSNWFDSPLLTECDPDKCMEIFEIRYKEFIPHYESGGVGASSGSVPENVNLPMDTILPIVFDPSVPQSITAKAALVAILDASNAASTVRPYLQIEGNPTCDDGPIFTYCIKRTDAGDAGALAQIKSDYSAYVQAGRTSYVGGVSSYSVSFLNVTSAPAGVTFNTVVDTVSVGTCLGECLTGDCPPLTPCTSC